MPGGMGPHGPRGGAPTEKADDLAVLVEVFERQFVHLHVDRRAQALRRALRDGLGGALKDLMRFSRRYIPAIIVALVLGVVGTVCQIIGPDYLGDMTDEIEPVPFRPDDADDEPRR